MCSFIWEDQVYPHRRNEMVCRSQKTTHKLKFMHAVNLIYSSLLRMLWKLTKVLMLCKEYSLIETFLDLHTVKLNDLGPQFYEF